MKSEYEQIRKFMVDYCRDYSAYAQGKKTMPKMDKYWAPDIKVTAFMQLKGGEYPLRFENRQTWQDFLIKGHIKILEELIPLEIIVDMEQMKVGVVLRIKKYNRVNNKILHELDGFGYYNLRTDNKKSLQITSLDFYAGDPQTFTSLYNI